VYFIIDARHVMTSFPFSTQFGQRGEFPALPGIALGMLLQLQFQGLGSSRSTLVGMEPGKFLIVNTPPIAEIGSKLFMKNHAIVRYLSSGNVYAFRCTLLRLIKDPFRLSVLSYPESFENMNLRKHERISCILDASVSLDEKKYDGLVTDLSIGGCNFEFSKSDSTEFPDIKIADELLIFIQLKQRTDLEGIHVAVRSMQKDKDSLSLGMEFVAADQAAGLELIRKELADFIHTIEEY
jgi:c-di-GMP-binding flagellar brake protein YcgR